MARSRQARPSDVGEIALSLPETAQATVWGSLPAYQVRGKSFVIYRGPRQDALDERSERLPDVILFAVAGPEEKDALLGSGPPWFTTSHFDGYNAILVRESHLGQIRRDELAEVVQDAWLATAPKRLAKEWLAGRGS